MDGSHIAGGGLGALAGVILAALGTRIGLNLDDTTAAGVAAACLSAGVAFGHAFGIAWKGAGVFPSIRRGLFGAKMAQNPAVRTAVVVPPSAAPPAA